MNPIARDQAIRLWASQVTAGELSIQQVDFYGDADGDGELDPAVDQPLGTSFAPYTNGTSWYIDLLRARTLPPGTNTVFAVATEAFSGATSNVVSVQVEQP